jgi:hypothetical protein
MLHFNASINNLGLEELKLYGNKYTWINKQESPLLERLDWFLASVSWVINYPRSSIRILSRDTSDHSPCLVSISTDIPKIMIFRFKNYWLLHDEFMQTMKHGWSLPCNQNDKAKKLGAKFKNVGRVLKQWHSQISNLAKTIDNNKMILSLLDALEEF